MKKFNGKKIKEVQRYPQSMSGCDMTLWEVYNSDCENTGEYLMFDNNNPCEQEYIGSFANLDEVDEYMKEVNTIWVVRDREAGNVIDEFVSYEEAEEALAEYERFDEENGEFEPDFYEIVKGGE